MAIFVLIFYLGVIFLTYVLQNTDIFNENIDEKFKDAFLKHQDDYNKDEVYKLIISFHVNYLNDQSFEEISLPVKSKISKNTRNDKIYDLLSFQLDKIEQILSEHGIITYNTTIQGVYLDKEDIIKIEIKEDKVEQKYEGDRKNNRRLTMRSIVPSLPSTCEIASKLATENLNKIYNDFMSVIRNKKIMSEILGIEETEDDNQLFKVFVEQYGDLWLATEERKRELLTNFQERSMIILRKYSDNH